MAKRVVLSERSARTIAATVEAVRKMPGAQKSGARARGAVSYKYTRLFELIEELTEGGSATARLVRWDEGTEDWLASDDEADEFEVYDFIGSMTGEEDTRGIAQNMFGKWVIIQLACGE